MNSIPSVFRSFAGSPAASERRPAVARRAARFFLLNALLGAAVLVAAAITIGSEAGAVKVVPDSRASQVTLFGLHLTSPSVNFSAALLLGLAIVGFVALVRAAAGAFAEVRRSRRFVRALATRAQANPEDYVVFAEPGAQAFCAGLLSPRIYVSTGALRALSARELDAVLAHERHHRGRYDPLRIALGRVLTRALFFLPMVSAMHARYCAMAELAADERAISSQSRGAQALASALLAFGEGQAAVGVAPERVDQMLGRAPNWPLPAAVVVGAVAAAAFVVAFALQLAQFASVRASFSLPVFSARPCIVMLALIPTLVVGIAVSRVRRAA